MEGNHGDKRYIYYDWLKASKEIEDIYFDWLNASKEIKDIYVL